MPISARNLYFLRLAGALLLAIGGMITGWQRIKAHTAVELLPEYSHGIVPAARFNGTFLCVSATVGEASISSQLGKCIMLTTHAGAVGRFEADLRDGTFISRETDLRINDTF
jgi:hypothetical protein